MFATASAVERVGPGRYTARFDETWFQGPGVYGGLSGAVLLRAMAAEVGGRPPRSLTVQYATRVVAGPAEIEVTVERTGTGMAFASARLLQDGVRIHGVASFGGPRPTELDEDHERLPSGPSAAEAPPFVWRPPFPAFLQHFRLGMISALPYSGATHSGVRTWVKSVDDEEIDVFLATGVLDVPPPAILPRAATLRPVSTVIWHVHYLADFPLATRDALLVDLATDITRVGYSDQVSRMFDPETRRLVAYGRQLVAVS